MSNWLVMAQIEEKIPEPETADQPNTNSVEDVLANDPEVQQMIQWFRRFREAADFAEQAKVQFQEKLRSLGINDASQLPSEINELFQ